MKVFAVVPALLVLVSLCGSPVPPPPGVVQGTVFYDANRNGIHDSCDTPLISTDVVVQGPNGEPSEGARTDASGNFEIEAPVGDGLVTLHTTEGQVWPITTEPGAVHVQSAKTVSGVEIGTAGKAAYDARTVSVSGVIYEDANANGLIDRDECPLISLANSFGISAGPRIAVVSNGVYELKNMPADAVLPDVEATYGLYGSAVSYRGDPARPLSPTTGSPGDGPCTVTVRPKQRYAPNIYEANIGFGRSTGATGSLSGEVFNDANGNGVRDEGEEGMAGISLYFYAAGDVCYGAREPIYVTSDENGEFFAAQVPSGAYAASISSYSADPATFLSWPGQSSFVVTVGTDQAHADIPLKFSRAGAIQVLAFDDANGNGVRDAGETGVSNVAFCLTPADIPPGMGIGDGFICPWTDDSGVATMPTLPPGDYEVSFQDAQGFGFVTSPGGDTLSVHVAEGETRDVAFALDVITPAEQVIYPGSGEQALEFTVCYAEPAWTNPPFAEPGPGSLAGQMGITPDQASKIYAHGIYPVSVNGWTYETAIWFDLARTGALPQPLCSESEPIVFALVGYEPLDVVTTFKSGIAQVRLRKTGSGLQAVSLAATADGGNLSYLFVDENYQPIVRCLPYGYCEWNDGSSPVWQGEY